MTMGIELAKRHPSARLVFTGGDGTLVGGDGRTEAEAAHELFHLGGIRGERLVLEDRSRNTRENALFTRGWCSRSPASAGFSSPRPFTSRAQSAAFVQSGAAAGGQDGGDMGFIAHYWTGAPGFCAPRSPSPPRQLRPDHHLEPSHAGP